MTSSSNALLLRIYLGEDDKHAGRPLYENIVTRARDMRLAGATVLRGPMGYGRGSRLHTNKILRLSEDLPVVVEIVDDESRIHAYLEAYKDMLDGVLVTLEKVSVLRLGGTETPNTSART